MFNGLSRKEKKLRSELDMTGLAIEDVYGSRKSSPLFLCLSKALIIFTVCVGTVTGFCDAFSLNYNKFAIVVFTFITSVLVSLLYARKKIFYVGYVAFLILFTLELLRYYLYANSGFQAITNRVREAYAEFFNMSVVRSAEERFTDRRLTITIALIFIIAFLVIMYNITVSRYMNFAETLGISFIILEIPLYIGNKPPLLSVMLIMAGCICTGLLGKGAFNRVTIPGKNSPDYIRDRFFKKAYYTTRGDHRGILMILACSLIFSFFICIFSLPVYDRSLGETPEDSAKASIDDTVKILVQNGIYGLFNRYDSLNGLNRGALGGVSSANPDFKTDLVVSFVPYSSDTVYLPGYFGITYSGMGWYNWIKLSDFPELGITGTDIVDSLKTGELDYNITRNVLKVKDVTTGIMQIAYIDKSFGMQVYPYITYPENHSLAETPLYEPKDPEKETVLETEEAKYYPIKYAEYLYKEENTASDSGAQPVVSEKELNAAGYYLDKDSSVRINYMDELSSGLQFDHSGYGTKYDELSYKDYVYDVCLQVPEALDRYLDSFVKEHSGFGLKNLNKHRLLTNELNDDRENGFPVKLTEYDPEAAGLSSDFIASDKKYYTYDLNGVFEEITDTKETINEYRMEACEAIRDMFLEDYPYTLSPGKTPTDEDFVRYFLESQRRGFCSHFASAAVMILRNLGIPARYVEGYCIPNSLVRESGRRLDKEGEYWLNLEDNTYNPGNAMYQVEVSDYYAHAWVEVYLEGQGFVPFEFTPPSYEAVPEATQMTGLGRFFSQMLNVDLGFGNDASESSSSTILDTGNTADTPAIDEKSGMEFGILLVPLMYVIGAAAIFWILFLLIRKVLREIKYAGYLKKGEFAPLVYARYLELVDRFKRKKVIDTENPLPMELCSVLAGYGLPLEVSGEERTKLYNDRYSELADLFIYAERVMYSDHATSAEEYSAFYRKLKEI